MERKIISISDNEAVAVPSEVRMGIYEIANLFGLYYQSTKRHIRAIEKSGIADGDYSMTCTVEGLKVYPNYYGLNMVVAVAFRMQSANAKVLRRWVIKKILSKSVNTTIVLKTDNSQVLN